MPHVKKSKMKPVYSVQVSTQLDRMRHGTSEVQSAMRNYVCKIFCRSHFWRCFWFAAAVIAYFACAKAVPLTESNTSHNVCVCDYMRLVREIPWMSVAQCQRMLRRDIAGVSCSFSNYTTIRNVCASPFLYSSQ